MNIQKKMKLEHLRIRSFSTALTTIEKGYVRGGSVNGAAHTDPEYCLSSNPGMPGQCMYTNRNTDEQTCPHIPFTTGG